MPLSSQEWNLMPLTPLQEDLWVQVESLAYLCRRLPETDPVRRMLESTVYTADDTQPDPRKLEKCHAAFYAMPAGKLKHVMNGWAVQPRHHSRENLLACIESEGIHRVLSLEVRPTTDDSASSMIAVHDFEFGGSAGPSVCLTISEGASLGSVLAAIDQLKDCVERDWQKLISDNCGSVDLDERREEADAIGKFLAQRDMNPADRVSPDTREIASAENECMLNRRAYAAA